jgi:mono/diheme cytochrome c family protein
MSKKAYHFIALIFLFSLLLTACGGSEEATNGEELFAQSVIGSQAGCSTCHSLEPGVTLVGPSMAGIGSIAETRVPDMSAEEYLRQSILEPDAHVVEGFPAGTMPKVWGEVLTEEQINQLVDYLLQLK